MRALLAPVEFRRIYLIGCVRGKVWLKESAIRRVDFWLHQRVRLRHARGEVCIVVGRTHALRRRGDSVIVQIYRALASCRVPLFTRSHTDNLYFRLLISRVQQLWKPSAVS